MMFSIIILFALALLLLIFTLQNPQPVDIDIIFWTITQVPLALTIFCCVILGVVIGVGIMFPRNWKKQSKIKSLTKELNSLKELIRVATPADNKTDIISKNPDGVRINQDIEKTIFDDTDL